MAVLILHAVPFWLAGIDPKRVREKIRPEILRHQREVVDVLYICAQSPKAMTAPVGLVPVEQITKPGVPADDAGLDAWREYHRQMVLWIDWQHDIEAWRGSVESRLEGLEEVTNLIPEILERMGPQTLTSDHQRAAQKFVQRVNKLTGRSRFGAVVLMEPRLAEEIRLHEVARRDPAQDNAGLVVVGGVVNVKRKVSHPLLKN